MDVAENKPDSPAPDKPSFFKPPRHILFVLLLVVVTVAVASFIVINNKEDSTPATTTQNTSKLYLSPATQEVAKGETVTISVWADSGSLNVNSVQATLSYPVDSFEFVNMDSTASAFEVQAQATHEDGKIVMTRGHIGQLSGPQLVGKLSLKALVDSGSAPIEFIDTSVLLSSDTNKDILGQKIDGNYSFKAAE